MDKEVISKNKKINHVKTLQKNSPPKPWFKLDTFCTKNKQAYSTNNNNNY